MKWEWGGLRLRQQRWEGGGHRLGKGLVKAALCFDLLGT
jgi:hypothetical protein